MGRRKILIVLLGLFLFTSLIIWAAEPPLIAVVNFKNDTGEKRYDHLEGAIARMLITDLIASKEVKVIERERLMMVLEEMKLGMSGVLDPGTAKEVGGILGVDLIILGNINKAGKNLRIDAHIVKVKTGEIIQAAKVYGTHESQLIQMVDILASKLIAGLTGKPVEVKPLPPVPLARTLNLSTEVDNSYQDITGDLKRYLQINLQAREIEPKESKRLPLNLSIVIDRSGSMASENKLEYAKQAACVAVDNLSSDDILSIVIYDNEIETILKPQRVINKEAIKRKIRELTPGGSTNLCGGMLEGYKNVYQNFSPKRFNRVLLLSDGLANVGETDPLVIRNKAQDYYKEGVTISTFGVGLNYNENLMLNLAEYGSGNYYFIDDPLKVVKIFEKEFKGLLSIIAKDIDICLRLDKSVKLETIYGYLYETEGNEHIINISNFLEGDKKFIIASLVLPKRKEGKFTIGEVTIDYRDVTSGKKLRERSEVSVTYTKDKDLIVQNVNPSVVKNVEMTKSAWALERAWNLMDEGKREEARKVVREQQTRAITTSLKYRDITLQENAEMLDGIAVRLEEAPRGGLAEKKLKKSIQMKSYEEYKQKK